MPSRKMKNHTMDDHHNTLSIKSLIKTKLKDWFEENKCLTYLEACSGMLTQRWHRCAEASRASSSLCTSQWCSLNRWAGSCRGWLPHRKGQSMSVKIQNRWTREMITQQGTKRSFGSTSESLYFQEMIKHINKAMAVFQILLETGRINSH